MPNKTYICYSFIVKRLCGIFSTIVLLILTLIEGTAIIRCVEKKVEIIKNLRDRQLKPTFCQKDGPLLCRGDVFLDRYQKSSLYHLGSL